jgi:hypothetical protein
MVEYATIILVGVFFEEHKVRFLLRQCSKSGQEVTLRYQLYPLSSFLAILSRKEVLDLYIYVLLKNRYTKGQSSDAFLASSRNSECRLLRHSVRNEQVKESMQWRDLILIRSNISILQCGVLGSARADAAARLREQVAKLCRRD